MAELALLILSSDDSHYISQGRGKTHEMCPPFPRNCFWTFYAYFTEVSSPLLHEKRELGGTAVRVLAFNLRGYRFES